MKKKNDVNQKKQIKIREKKRIKPKRPKNTHVRDACTTVDVALEDAWIGETLYPHI